MTTIERIKLRAEDASKNTITAMSDTETITFWEGYVTGAKFERNKTIGEMLEKLDKGYKEYVWYKHLREEINSLKI